MSIDPALLHLIIGLVSGGVGSYVGLKVGLLRVQIYMKLTREELERLMERTLRHNDSLLTLNIEMGSVFDRLKMNRYPRERAHEQASRRENWERDT